jgi:hypothetical protein
MTHSWTPARNSNPMPGVARRLQNAVARQRLSRRARRSDGGSFGDVGGIRIRFDDAGGERVQSPQGSRASAGAYTHRAGNSRSSGTAPGAPDRSDRRVAVALVRSGTVGTIALEECARRAAAAAPQNRAAEFGRKGKHAVTGEQPDSDECFVAEAIARSCRGDTSKRSPQLPESHDRCPSEGIVPRPPQLLLLLGEHPGHARSLARWPESHREQARGAFAEPPGAS